MVFLNEERIFFGDFFLPEKGAFHGSPSEVNVGADTTIASNPVEAIVEVPESFLHGVLVKALG